MSDALHIERVDAAHVRVSGALGFSEAGSALRRGEELFSEQAAPAAVEIDVSGLGRVDSATLAVLLAWAARAASKGMRLRFNGVSADLRALAHLCDAEPLLGIA